MNREPGTLQAQVLEEMRKSLEIRTSARKLYEASNDAPLYENELVDLAQAPSEKSEVRQDS